MSEEIRLVQIGPNTVEVEVNPDDYKRPAIAWVALFFAGLMLLASGFAFGWIPLAATPVAWLTHRLAWKGRVDMAVRRAAYDSIHRYDQSRIIGWKGL